MLADGLRDNHARLTVGPDPLQIQAVSVCKTLQREFYSSLLQSKLRFNQLQRARVQFAT